MQHDAQTADTAPEEEEDLRIDCEVRSEGAHPLYDL